MSFERGHLSIYFKDEETLEELQGLVEKDLKEKVSVSSMVCEVMRHAVPQIRKAVKKGIRTGIKISFEIDI